MLTRQTAKKRRGSVPSGCPHAVQRHFVWQVAKSEPMEMASCPSRSVRWIFFLPWSRGERFDLPHLFIEMPLCGPRNGNSLTQHECSVIDWKLCVVPMDMLKLRPARCCRPKTDGSRQDRAKKRTVQRLSHAIFEGTHQFNYGETSKSP